MGKRKIPVDVATLYRSFNIEDIEERIGKLICRNTSVIGVDIAKRNTGLCVLRTTKTKLQVCYFDKIQVKTQGKIVHPCLDEFIREFKLFKLRLAKKFKKLDVMIIEDCWMGKNVWTLKMLSKYEVLFYVGFKKLAQDIPDPRQARSARAKVGFKKDTTSKLDVKKQIQQWIYDKFRLEIKDQDHADAFILALSGLTGST